MYIVLAVDGVKEHLQQWEKALSSQFQLITAGNIRETLQLLKDVLPDMILSALDLPDGNALELMEQMSHNTEWNGIPVVISSERYDTETERLCFQKGAVEYLHYPIDGQVLLSRMKHSLEVQHTRQRLEAEVLRKSLEIERKNAEMRRQRFLVELSKYDSLTGALKREDAMRQINMHLSKHRTGAFLILDMDNFKAVNDTYGHIEGDKLLVKFARVLKEESGSDAVVARLGGDEFIVFFAKKMSKTEVKRSASGIVKKVEREILSPGRLVRVTVSVGIAVAPDDGKNFEELYSKADKALYYVKNEGKNDYHFFGEHGKKMIKKGLTSTSLSDITRNMGEKIIMNGSYMVDYNSFEKIYRFIERNMKRDPRQVQCVLLTLEEQKENTMEAEDFRTEMEQLGDVVVKSLRKGDVSAYYSATQLLLLLLDTDYRNATLVVERIINQYYNVINTEDIGLTYEIQTVTGEMDEVTEVV